jgi:hypothetical protein
VIKVAIVSRPDSASPRVLAETLHDFIGQTENRSEVFYALKALRRLSGHADVKRLHGFVPWLLYRSLHWVSDYAFFAKLRSFDAIVICECSPLAFLKYSFDIRKLKARSGKKPVLLYEVYFLGNAPTVLDALMKRDQHLVNAYDWHLAVSKVTEIAQEPQKPWSQIGLYLRGTGLRPNVKQRLLAVVDFEREGYEDIRKAQIEVLRELAIPYISLEKRYTIQEIREIYQEATFYFIQFPEAFGLPIAECLCCGCYILVPDSSWAMSWRLNKNPQIHGPGVMADCFIVYNGVADLKDRMMALKEDYDLKATPQKVFQSFREHYPTFYEGNLDSLRDLLRKIEQHEF